MTDTTMPITNQEITAAAERITHGLVAYALSSIRDLLGTDAIGEAISDDQDAGRLDRQAHGIVFGLVWDQLGQAAAEYTRNATACPCRAETVHQTGCGQTGGES
jgi:hypothetical protein